MENNLVILASSQLPSSFGSMRVFKMLRNVSTPAVNNLWACQCPLEKGCIIRVKAVGLKSREKYRPPCTSWTAYERVADALQEYQLALWEERYRGMPRLPAQLPESALQRHTLHIQPAALAWLCAEKWAFSICYRGKEAAFTLTPRKMSYRNIQRAFFIVRGPQGEAVVISRDWKLAC